MNPEISATDRPIDRWARSPELGRLADAIQPAVFEWFEAQDAAHRPIKDLLHGTFLGHALHPMLTDVPIGAWTVTAVCDLLELAGSSRFHNAADTSLVIGTLGAAGAAITGLADWSDTKDEPKNLGALHASVNTAALACYLGSLAGRRAGARKFGVALSLIGYGILTAGAYLGGELAMGMQLGARHTAVPIEPGDDFVPVAADADVVEGAMQSGNAKGIPVLLTRSKGKLRAVSGVCTHRGAPLADGSYEDACVRCPWHGSRFSLEDGAVVEGPATFPLAQFETQIIGSDVAVRPLAAHDDRT